MAWYNKALNKDNFNKFYSNIDNDLIHFPEHLYKEDKVIFANQVAHANNLEKLNDQLCLSWDIIDKIRQRSCFINKATHHSHLKGLKQNKSPCYTACFYLCGSNPTNNGEIKVINLSIEGNDVFVEIRYPLAEFFSIHHFSEKYPEITLGFINGLPKFSVQIFSKKYSKERLLEFLLEYISKIENFLRSGSNLRTAGESRAEIHLKEALEYCYKDMHDGIKNWLQHGTSPISFNNNYLEIDLLLVLRGHQINSQQKFAIEIQGPYHYQDLAPHQGNWGNTEQKHEAKIQWCIDNECAFIWVDWKAFHRIFIMNRQTEWSINERRQRIKIWMDEVIRQYAQGSKFIALIQENRAGHLPQPQNGQRNWCNTIGFLKNKNMIPLNL